MSKYTGMYVFVAFVVFIVGLYIAISYDTRIDHENIQACLSQPNHDWVENAHGNFECVTVP